MLASGQNPDHPECIGVICGFVVDHAVEDYYRIGGQYNFLMLNQMCNSLCLSPGKPGGHIFYRHIVRETFVYIGNLYRKRESGFPQQLAPPRALGGENKRPVLNVIWVYGFHTYALNESIRAMGLSGQERSSKKTPANMIILISKLAREKSFFTSAR